MAFKAGRAAVVSVNGVDLSAYHAEVGWQITADQGDTTVFGATWKTSLGTLLGGSASMSGYYDPQGAGAPVTLITACVALVPVTMIIKPGGAVTGQQVVTVSVNLTNYGESIPVGGIIGFTCQAEFTGAAVFTAVA